MPLDDPQSIYSPGNGYSKGDLSADAQRHRRFLASTYGLMAGGVAVAAATAFMVANVPPLRTALFTGGIPTMLGWLVTFAPLTIVFIFGPEVRTLSLDAARGLFLLYTALVGASLGYVLLVFTTGSVGETLAGVAIGFAVLSIVGSRLRYDLSGARSFMMFTLVGVIAALLLNMVVGSAGIDAILSIVIVLFFSFATLYDAQRIEQLFVDEAGSGMLDKAATLAALTLFLDLLNPFVAMLRFVGRRR